MLPDMIDIASQMIAKWDRLGPDNAISASDDFTICDPSSRNHDQADDLRTGLPLIQSDSADTDSKHPIHKCPHYEHLNDKGY